MPEFKYVDKPGWIKQYTDEHGCYDGEVLAVSPELLALTRDFRITPDADARQSEPKIITATPKRPARKRAAKV